MYGGADDRLEGFDGFDGKGSETQTIVIQRGITRAQEWSNGGRWSRDIGLRRFTVLWRARLFGKAQVTDRR